MKLELKRLKDLFDEDDVDWKPVAVSKKTGKGLAAAYVTNRAIMDRLDEVCGPENWRNEYAPGPSGGVVCGLSIRISIADGGEWVTKWDGAENTDIEPVKGGLSTSMRRAAVQWGIGRYMYRMPSQWVPVDGNGRFTKKPTIPHEFLPSRGSSTGTAGHPTQQQALTAPDPATLSSLHAAASAFGFTKDDREARLAFVSRLVGYDVGYDIGSFKDLSDAWADYADRALNYLMNNLHELPSRMRFAAFCVETSLELHPEKKVQFALTDFTQYEASLL